MTDSLSSAGHDADSAIDLKLLDRFINDNGVIQLLRAVELNHLEPQNLWLDSPFPIPCHTSSFFVSVFFTFSRLDKYVVSFSLSCPISFSVASSARSSDGFY